MQFSILGSSGSGHDAAIRLFPRESSAERELGRLENEYGLTTPFRVRGRERVALHADLTMLARLSHALARARAFRLPCSGFARCERQ